MKRQFNYLFIFFLFLCLFGNGNEHRGILFKSKEVSLEQRTGIDITRKGKVLYTDNFSIDFEISFRDLQERYGYILQLKEPISGHQFELIYNIDGRFPDLFIVIDKKETRLQMALSQEQIKLVNRWHPFHLEVDAVSGTISMTFDGKTVTDKIDLPQKSKLDWTFGIVNRYGFEVDEVAPMSVRNIKYYVNDKLKHYWPLDFVEGTTVKDSLEGKKVELINPAWVTEQHQRWQKVKTFEFEEFPQIAFKIDSEEFYFVQRKNGIVKYGLNSRTVNTLKYQNGNPFYEDAQQVFFDKDKQLRTYSRYKKLAPKFYEPDNTWNNSYDTLAYLPKYWHHNMLLHPSDGSIVAIAGYGFFTYFNTIRKLDEETKEWENLHFTGDSFQPRYLASIGQSQMDSSVYYLFGGLGNSTGKQILGKEFYYDLYKIDFEESSITKMWELPNSEESCTPVNSMIVNDTENCFYTLNFAHNSNHTELQLLKVQLNAPEYDYVGSSIPYTFHDITSFANLYQWKSHNKILAITLHKKEDGNFEVNIYSLNFPPSQATIKPEGVINSNKLFFNNLLLLPIFIFVLAAIVFLLMLKKKRRGKEESDTIFTTDSKFIEKDYSQGRILTFGGFQVLDKKGTDITYRFSPTLKELFLLILINTIDDNKGISSQKIREYLWPDKTEHQAKNNRGVNIKKLRSILEDVGDMNISYDGSCWRISHSDQVYCDLEYIRDCFSKGLDVVNIENFERVISVLKRGDFLTNTDSEWLDKVKDDLSGRIVSRLEEVCNRLDVRNNEAELLEISDVIFTFDQMNETALQIKCMILNHQGKHSLALEVYSHYVKLYRSLYNEDFSTSFKRLVS